MPGTKKKASEKKDSKPETENTDTLLIGYARMSKSEKTLNLSLDTDELKKASTYKSEKDEETYGNLIINLKKIDEVCDGDRDFTPVVGFKPKE